MTGETMKTTVVNFVDRAVDFLFKTNAGKNGLVKTYVSYTETKSGGVSVNTTEAKIKGFINRERLAVNKANSNKADVSFVGFCEMLQKRDSMNSLTRFYFDKEGNRVQLSAGERNKRLQSLSKRIIESFAPICGTVPAGSILTEDQMFVILKEAASMFVRVRTPYVQKVKVVKADKTEAKQAGATPAKPEGDKKPARRRNRNRKPAQAQLTA